MNKNITINIIFIISSILSYRLFLKELDLIYTVVIIFISFCIFNLVLLRDGKPKTLTKESDELLHPVTENLTVLHICHMQKLYGKNYNKNYVEACECGSTLFRIYNDDTEKGTYVQFICAKCNQKATGYEFNWKQKV